MNPLIEFQKQIGAVPDGGFGPETLKKGTAFFKLTASQGAHFFGQCSHESAGFTIFTENLNYSAQSLVKVFGKYFPNISMATQYARQPIKIANKVYSNRMGNGSEASGDGWKYRGRGPIQLTGSSNYSLFAQAMHDNEIVSNPDIVLTKYAFQSAKWFFDHNSLWSLCTSISESNIVAVTKRINGGTNGLAHRRDMTKKYYSWLV
ncbi:MAG: glycoside hydrolase family 19 protein [Gammaproteobacteria bacterium]|nr:glycoside hydrolase family 19 protein [Gammaproteobacteria bacterium]